MNTNTNSTTTLLKYDTTSATTTKNKKKDGESLKMPKLPRNNNVIICKLYKNVALFTGDTYTYRGIFKRNSGDFNKKLRGYIVPLDCIQSIRAEIYPQVQGYLIYRECIDLPINIEPVVIQKNNTSQSTIQNIDTMDDDY